MSELITILMDIISAIGGFIFPNKHNEKNEIDPIPGEPFILLLLCIFFSIIAFLLSQTIKIDKQLYFSLSIIFVICSTFLSYLIIRKVYYLVSLSK